MPFGAYAHGHAEATTSNDAMSRTVGGISLRPTGNLQGKFLNLLPGRLIRARSFTPLPIPKGVIMAVEEMGGTRVGH
jgi:hypothetical protein